MYWHKQLGAHELSPRGAIGVANVSQRGQRDIEVCGMFSVRHVCVFRKAEREKD
jgi:hypothetical protein